MTFIFTSEFQFGVCWIGMHWMDYVKNLLIFVLISVVPIQDSNIWQIWVFFSNYGNLESDDTYGIQNSTMTLNKWLSSTIINYENLIMTMNSFWPLWWNDKKSICKNKSYLVCSKSNKIKDT